jgi:hypothetical protein
MATIPVKVITVAAIQRIRANVGLEPTWTSTAGMSSQRPESYAIFNVEKFSQYRLPAVLRKTGDAYLQRANPRTSFCRSTDHRRVADFHRRGDAFNGRSDSVDLVIDLPTIVQLT